MGPVQGTGATEMSTAVAQNKARPAAPAKQSSTKSPAKAQPKKGK